LNIPSHFKNASLHSLYLVKSENQARKLCAEIRKFFTGVRLRTPIHVYYFKNGQNWCRRSCQKAALRRWQKRKTKHVSASTCRTPEAISSISMWVNTVARHLYSEFRSDPFRFGELRKSLHDPKVITIEVLW